MEFQKIFGPEPKQLDWYGIINFTFAVLLDCKWHKYKYSIHISEENEQAVWRSVTPDPEKPKAGDEPRDAKPEKPPDAEPENPPDAEPEKPPDAEPEKPPDAEPENPPDAEPEKPPDAEPEKPPDAEPEKPPDAEPEKPPEPKKPQPEGEKRKKKKGYTKGPPPPPKNSVVDDFCFFSATGVMPTSARIKILDPLRSRANAIWAEVAFERWLQGYPPRIVSLRPSRVYRQYRFQDYSFWRPPPPERPSSSSLKQRLRNLGRK